MRYPGAFTFINRDSATLPNVKDHKDDTAISTHISRTRRKWTEEKRKVRLELLGRPDRKAQVVDVKVISRILPSPSLQLCLPHTGHTAEELDPVSLSTTL